MSANYEPTITPEMRARYIERRRADLSLLDEARAQKNFDVMAKVAHQIKGNAATFSFSDLEGYAIDLESAAQAQDMGAAESNIDLIRHWLNKQT